MCIYRIISLIPCLSTACCCCFCCSAAAASSLSFSSPSTHTNTLFEHPNKKEGKIVGKTLLPPSLPPTFSPSIIYGQITLLFSFILFIIFRTVPRLSSTLYLLLFHVNFHLQILSPLLFVWYLLFYSTRIYTPLLLLVVVVVVEKAICTEIGIMTTTPLQE